MISLILFVFSTAVFLGIFKALSSPTIQSQNNRLRSPGIPRILNKTLGLCSPGRTTSLSSSVKSISPSTCSDVQSDLDKTVDLWAFAEFNSPVSQLSKDSPWTPLKKLSPVSPYTQDDLDRTVGLGSPFLPKSDISPCNQEDLDRTVGLGTPFLPKSVTSPATSDLNRTVGLGTPFLPKSHASQDTLNGLSQLKGPLSSIEAVCPFCTWTSTRSKTPSRIPKRIRVQLQFEGVTPPSPKPQRLDATDRVLEIPSSPYTLLATAVKQKYFPNTPPPDEEISEEEDEDIRRLRSLAFKKRPSQQLRETKALRLEVEQMVEDSRMRRMQRQLCREQSAE